MKEFANKVAGRIFPIVITGAMIFSTPLYSMANTTDINTTTNAVPSVVPTENYVMPRANFDNLGKLARELRQKDMDIKVNIGGKLLEFSEDSGRPYVDEANRTQIPIRIAMEAMECEVEWNQAEKKAVISKGDIKLEIPVGAEYILRNGKQINIDSSAVLKNNRVYLPIRHVAEAFGSNVGWNQMTKTVMVNMPEDMQIHFIDVAHGDASLIKYKDFEILIDAGDAAHGEKVSEYIKPYISGKLDIFIATHAHTDHIGGAPRVFSDYEIDRAIVSGSSLDTPEWHAFEASLNTEGCKVSEDADELIEVDGDFSLEIVEALDGQPIENNNSVVSIIRYKDIKVLIAGDSQMEAEDVMAERLKEHKINVFRSDHHGSFNANGEKLLSTLNPEYIIVSAGKGEGYKHPHAVTMKRMLITGAIIYGTFKSGDMVMVTDGVSYEIRAPKSGEQAPMPLKQADAGTYQKNVDKRVEKDGLRNISTN